MILSKPIHPNFKIIEQELLRIEKPGRYVGGEFNQVYKEWESVSTHIALVFPDIYDIGVPNLGIAILYDILNKQEDALAERAFSPWVDMEDLLRDKHFPMFSLESKTPLNQFDILGFTFPYETIYTNTLNILDLANIPLYSKDRDLSHPLIIAGGQSVYNPEPMADFIDAFILGEGEEVILEVVNIHKAWKLSRTDKSELLMRLSELEGVYVPSLYEVTYNLDGTILNFIPKLTQAPTQINKRIVAKLPPPVTKFIVPNIETVHDRISIEIMRGCTRGCRFCHAGMVNRPIRERSVEDIIAAIQSSLLSTGYENISLLSLSSSDHTKIVDIVDQVQEHFENQKLTVTLPSLRIASFSVELMDKLKGLRPGGGFTIAPEAATERLRAIINKPLPDSELMETVTAVFEHGWMSLKLYFMIGLPEETNEDVEAIIDICRKIKSVGKAIVGGRVRINVGIGTFLPKPHTPFQWLPADSSESIDHKLSILREGFRQSGIKMSYNRSASTSLETWLSRGDRRMGEVIYNAWKNGARFDAWSDQLNFQAWLDAFQQAELDPAFYGERMREVQEILPWDHISVGLRKEFLIQDLNWSMQGKTRPDCREHCYRCGILPLFEELRNNTPDVEWSCP